MPRFTVTECFPQPLADVFDFYCRPARRIQLAPPELHLQLVSAPEVIALGLTITLRGRRVGITQHMVTEVTAFEPRVLLVEEQRQGPFRKWVHSFRFEPSADGGTHLVEEIDYEPPGGMLGLLVTARKIEADLERLYAYRREKWAELWA